MKRVLIVLTAVCALLVVAAVGEGVALVSDRHAINVLKQEAPVVGPQGLKGDPGPAGPAGPQGPPGAAAPAPTTQPLSYDQQRAACQTTANAAYPDPSQFLLRDRSLNRCMIAAGYPAPYSGEGE